MVGWFLVRVGPVFWVRFFVFICVDVSARVVLGLCDRFCGCLLVVRWEGMYGLFLSFACGCCWRGGFVCGGFGCVC